MATEIREYRYQPAVRQRAMLLAGLSAVLALALVGGLVLRWPDLGWGTRGLGIVLLLMALATARSQLVRALYRCRVEAEALRIIAPLASRVVPWSAVVEVRQLRLPQLSGTAKWACTLLVRGRQASPTPLFMFDDQLEDAALVLEEIVRRTPQAQHLLRS